jgi:hypothetical protein
MQDIAFPPQHEGVVMAAEMGHHPASLQHVLESAIAGDVTRAPVGHGAQRQVAHRQNHRAAAPLGRQKCGQPVHLSGAGRPGTVTSSPMTSSPARNPSAWTDSS